MYYKSSSPILLNADCLRDDTESEPLFDVESDLCDFGFPIMFIEVIFSCE